MIGEKLKEIRIKNNLSQAHLADILGICRSAYCNYELGRRQPDFETVKILARYYKLPLDAFNDDETAVVRENYEVVDESVKYMSQLSKREQMLVLRYRDYTPKKQKEILKNF